MILHTINKPSALANCMDLIANDDQVLLLEDGVYLALTSLPFKVLVMGVDAQARGLADQLDNRCEVVDYPGFVTLCTEADKVCSWF